MRSQLSLIREICISGDTLPVPPAPAQVMMATGRVPKIQGLGLEDVGVQLGECYTADDRRRSLQARDPGQLLPAVTCHYQAVQSLSLQQQL